MPYCPVCRGEYREGYSYCKECGVDLVDELPEESEEEIAVAESGPAWRERLDQLFPAPLDLWMAARCNRALCWVLIAAAFSFLLYNSANYIDYYFSIRPWETEPAIIYNITLFLSALIDNEAFLAFILVIFLSAFVIKSRRSTLLRLQMYLAAFLAFWFFLDLVMLVITEVRYSAIREATDMGKLTTALILLGIVIFIGAATAILSAKLRKETLKERTENE